VDETAIESWRERTLVFKGKRRKALESAFGVQLQNFEHTGNKAAFFMGFEGRDLRTGKRTQG